MALLMVSMTGFGVPAGGDHKGRPYNIIRAVGRPLWLVIHTFDP